MDLNPSPWLQLGLGGGALFLVALIIFAWSLFLKNFMKSNAEKMDKLCDKIDKLVEALYTSNKCVSDMNVTTTNKYDNIKYSQDQQYRLTEKVYEKVVDIWAILSKEGE